MAHSTEVRKRISTTTLAGFGRERLLALCAGAGADEATTKSLMRLFEQTVLPWGDQVIGDRPRYPSCVADDSAPFEFCAAFSEGPPELQFYVEVLAEPPGLRANMLAGCRLLEQLAATLGGSLTRLRAVEDLLLPLAPQGPFTVWVGVSCSGERRPQLKVYLNPQVQGAAASQGLVGAAMERLGFAEAWSAFEPRLELSGARRDELAILSLDLSGEPYDRVKLYVRHHGATVEDVQSFVRDDPACAADVERFFAAVAPDRGPFREKPPITEASFIDVHRPGPSSFTLEFPVGKYAATDEEAACRIAACLSAFHLPSERYWLAARAFATRALSAGNGLHAHVTLRRQRNRPRVGVYFASEAYRIGEGG